jgi:hypothetical protein
MFSSGLGTAGLTPYPRNENNSVYVAEPWLLSGDHYRQGSFLNREQIDVVFRLLGM